MPRSACYVDGFNLYHAIDALDKPHLKWLNLRALTETFVGPGETLARIVYFSAFMIWEKAKYLRHKECVSALRSIGVEPVMSKFQRNEKHCRRFDRYCGFHEEKQTDVALATRLLSDAILDGLDRIILITADSDQVPTLASIRAIQPTLSILVACPPGRQSIARELGQVAHDNREISTGLLERCLFPRDVRNAQGSVVARSPASYQR